MDDSISEQFFKRAKEIQSKCICREFNEKECFRRRYPPPIDDCFGDEEYDDDYDECECVCHMELADLERDLWPDDDEMRA